MSSVPGNMKAFIISFTSPSTVFAPAGIHQAPYYPFTGHCNLASTDCFSNTSSQKIVNAGVSDQGIIITTFLTKRDEYVLNLSSQIQGKEITKMWITSSTLSNNKNRFVTLITPLFRFSEQTSTITVSNRSVNNKKKLTGPKHKSS